MKLAILLQSLQSSEHKEFEKFLQSPYFKASDQYLTFFKYLCKKHPAFDLDKDVVEEAYQRCFGAEALSDTKRHNLVSGLSKQLEIFLATQLLLTPDQTGQNILYDQSLVTALGKRNAGLYFRNESQKLIDNIEASTAKGTDEAMALHYLHQQVYFNPDTPKLPEEAPHLIQAASQLDLYFCINKLRYVAEMKARERIMDVQYEFPMLDMVLAHTAAAELLAAHPLIAMYHQLVRLYLGGVQEAGFRELIQDFSTRFSLLPKTDQVLLLRHCINCGISLMTKDCPVEPELLALYKLSIKANMLLVGGRITHFSFFNIANLAATCKEFEWCQAFIRDFEPLLEADKRQGSVDLAHADMYYRQGLLDKAQTALTPEIFSIPVFDLLGKITMVKIALDRFLLQNKDYEFLSAQLNAFEKLVPNKKLTPEKQEAYLNWIRWIRKIANLHHKGLNVSEAKKSQLKNKLESVEFILAKKWVVTRIELL